MKERIRRIVRDGCSNPRIGVRWTAALCILAVLATVSVAFAQRRPVERDQREAEEREELRERDERHELAVAGRRNVLRRLLEQLVAQTQDIEASLREGGDAMGEEGQVRRAELQALREHIEIVERQLHALEREDRGHNVPPEFVRHAEELRHHQHELATRAEHLELELRELGDGQPERRERIVAELRTVHSQLRAHDREMEELERVTGALEAIDRARHIDMREAEIRAALDQLDDSEDEKAQELRQALEELEHEKADFRAGIVEYERTRPGRGDRNIQIIEIRRRRGEEDRLTEAIEETERELDARHERGEGDSEGSRKLQRRLQELYARQREVEAEHEIARGRRRSSRDRTGDAMSMYGGYGGERDEMMRTDDGRIEITRERHITRDGPPEGGLESEVEELRKKVDGMHKQMEEMRRMLQQLLERDQSQRDVPPQETNAY